MGAPWRVGSPVAQESPTWWVGRPRVGRGPLRGGQSRRARVPRGWLGTFGALAAWSGRPVRGKAAAGADPPFLSGEAVSGAMGAGWMECTMSQALLRARSRYGSEPRSAARRVAHPPVSSRSRGGRRSPRTRSGGVRSAGRDECWWAEGTPSAGRPQIPRSRRGARPGLALVGRRPPESGEAQIPRRTWCRCREEEPASGLCYPAGEPPECGRAEIPRSRRGARLGAFRYPADGRSSAGEQKVPSDSREMRRTAKFFAIALVRPHFRGLERILGGRGRGVERSPPRSSATPPTGGRVRVSGNAYGLSRDEDRKTLPLPWSDRIFWD